MLYFINASSYSSKIPYLQHSVHLGYCIPWSKWSANQQVSQRRNQLWEALLTTEKKKWSDADNVLKGQGCNEIILGKGKEVGESYRT